MVGTGWHQELRSRGYRLTPQRQLVLDAVAELGHATPDEIAQRVRGVAAGVNISTVYRTLELLEELGLVRHAHLGHGAASYSVASTGEHVHLVCRGCGQVSDVDPAVFEGAVARLAGERGFVADIGHTTVFGRCVGCADAP